MSDLILATNEEFLSQIQAWIDGKIDDVELMAEMKAVASIVKTGKKIDALLKKLYEISPKDHYKTVGDCITNFEIIKLQAHLQWCIAIRGLSAQVHFSVANGKPTATAAIAAAAPESIYIWSDSSHDSICEALLCAYVNFLSQPVPK